jgi:hypothetical protein
MLFHTLVRVLALFCYLFGIGALLEREHTHRARVQPRSGMQIQFFRTLRRTPRVRLQAFTQVTWCTQKSAHRAQTTGRAATFGTAPH